MSGCQESKPNQSCVPSANPGTGTKRGRGPRGLTYEKVREMFDYDPETGNLIRKISCRRWKKGDLLKSIGKGGYKETRVEKHLHRQHRIIWLWWYGYYPENDIDHINKDPGDNRIANLREVSMTCNIRNSKKSKANRSGVRGVSWTASNRTWRVLITVGGKNKHLGCTPDIVEAAALRLAAEQCLDWLDCESNSSAAKTVSDHLKNLNWRNAHEHQATQETHQDQLRH